MSNFANIIFPQHVPETGQANRATPAPNSVAAQANRTAVLNPVCPTTATKTSSGLQPNTTATGTAKHNPNPYNHAPAIGVPAHTPLSTPIGVSPKQQTPTEIWTYDYGNGGGY